MVELHFRLWQVTTGTCMSEELKTGPAMAGLAGPTPMALQNFSTKLMYSYPRKTADAYVWPSAKIFV